MDAIARRVAEAATTLPRLPHQLMGVLVFCMGRNVTNLWSDKNLMQHAATRIILSHYW